MSSTGALVLADRTRKTTLFERLGSEIITLDVGKDTKTFSFHKKLLVDASEEFTRLCSQSPNGNGRYQLPNVSPDIFPLLINYLYGGDIPGLVMADEASMATNLRVLCQLYTFGEEYKMNDEFVNKVMDEIQDGFRKLNRVPEPGLISNIYKATKTGSKLRVFCAYSLVYLLQSLPTMGSEPTLAKLLTEIPELHLDFLAAIRNSNSTRMDTRIRNCGKDSRCAGCHHGVEHAHDGKSGMFPCWFHVHSPDYDCYKTGTNNDWEENRIADECYFNIHSTKTKSGL